MILIPKRKLGDIPTQQNLTIQETLRQVKGLNLDWANIKNAVIKTADIENLAVTTAKINTLAVTDAKIESLSISKLTVGNLAVVGTLTTGGYLKSTNYVADTSGWQVDYLGNAEFNSVKVRGSIYTSSIVSGNTLTVSGTLSAGAGGILLDTSGIEVIGNGQMIRFFATAPTGTPRALIQDTATELFISTNTGYIDVNSAGDLWLTAVGKIFASAATAIDFANIAYIDLPRFIFANTPATSEGRFGYNLTSHVLQYYNGTSWKVVATVE